VGGSNAYPDPAPKKWVGPDPEKLIGSTPLASMAGGHSDRYSGGLMSGWNLFCPLTGVGPICCGRICTTAGASQGNPREEGPADPGQPGPSPKGGGSSREGVAGMGTGPAGSADIDSGPLAASTIDLTGAWKEGVSETE